MVEATTLSPELGSLHIQINHREKILQNIFRAYRDKNNSKGIHDQHIISDPVISERNTRKVKTFLT